MINGRLCSTSVLTQSSSEDLSAFRKAMAASLSRGEARVHKIGSDTESYDYNH